VPSGSGSFATDESLGWSGLESQARDQTQRSGVDAEDPFAYYTVHLVERAGGHRAGAPVARPSQLRINGTVSNTVLARGSRAVCA